jgi:predicted 3-demethylubiquinone-9 3-methyltransferase (glyoxalase superfamily)
MICSFSIISLYVRCHTEGEIDRLYECLSEGGQLFMPLDAYLFSEKFVWLADRYGISWQFALDRQSCAQGKEGGRTLAAARHRPGRFAA